MTAAVVGGRRATLTGRLFVGPVFDYALIGGGLSLVATAGVVWYGESLRALDAFTLASIVLVSNMAHFASSTVRLYTKPGGRTSWPFLTLGLPLATLAVLTLCLAFPGELGAALTRLYLTWSPYHYAAQAYGLAVMYSYRSGCPLDARDKRLLRWACLLPFLHNFLTAPGIGLDWLAAPLGLGQPSWWLEARQGLGVALVGLGVAAPIALFLWLRRRPARPMPLICPLLMIANSIWWFVLLPRQAFVWATVFHGVQYLAIVIVFHVKDQLAEPGNRHGRAFHSLKFYGLSLLLGFALFRVLPQGFVFAGFGMVESLLLVVATINIHHFVVDAFIWRLGAGGSNRKIVDGSNGDG